MHSMAAALHEAGIPVLHVLVPPRSAVVGAEAATHPALALEQEAASWPLLAQDWLPLRQAFARDAQPMALWRHDGARVTVEGQMVLLRLLLAALRLRHPGQLQALTRAEALAARADLAALPRREIPANAGEAAGPAFLGVIARETEPALTDSIFADLPDPHPIGPETEGVEAWRSPGAPLPWRIVLLTTPGLGGSAAPAMLGWWLRRLSVECVVSEALELAPPAALVDAAPNLVVTLAAA